MYCVRAVLPSHPALDCFLLFVQDKETFTTQILDVNQGGMICRCLSLQAFIPISQLNSKIRGKNNWLSIEVCVCDH